MYVFPNTEESRQKDRGGARCACDGCVITLFNGFLVSSPLIADYVKNESRGSAAALASLGTLIGAAFGMIVLLGGTINMTLENSFKTVSGIMIILSLLNFFFVREPIIKLPGEKKAKVIGQEE